MAAFGAKRLLSKVPTSREEEENGPLVVGLFTAYLGVATDLEVPS
jgi:hypothetical protein